MGTGARRPAAYPVGAPTPSARAGA
jgi:hypothetical protein